MLDSLTEFIRCFAWDVICTLIKILNYILDSTIGSSGVLSFDALTSNSFVSGLFKVCLALMPFILVSKISYEVVRGMIMDDENDLNFQRKIAASFIGFTIAVSLTFFIPMANNLVKDVCAGLINIDSSTSEQLQLSENEDIPTTNFGDSLLVTVLEAFGGMPSSGDYSATKMVEAYEEAGDEFDINEKVGDDYMWDYSFLLTAFGLAVYIILFFIAMIQIALRMITITFFYVIGPLCCTSLTNFQNPQAFTVWKNSLIGQWFMNAGQIFLIVLFVQVIGSIQNTELTAIAKCALYFGSTTLVIMAPNWIQSMIGGYGAGIMETLNSLRGGFGIASGVAKGATGLVTGAIGATIGGGFAKTIGGQKSTSTDSSGAIITSRSGGLIGALAGNKTTRKDANGNTTTSRSGGAWGNWTGASSKTENKDGSTTTSRSGGVLGAVVGDYNSSVSSGSSGTEQGPSYGEGVSDSLSSGTGNEGEKIKTSSFSGGIRGVFSGKSTTTSDGNTKTTTRVGGLGGMKNVMSGKKFSAPRTNTSATWGSRIKRNR